MEFIDLKAQQQMIEVDLEQRIKTVLFHCQYIMGPEVEELEKRLAEFVGVKHVITCSSGTDSLLIPLMALGIGPGDAIFTTPFTFIATAEVIVLLGATPVFVDINPRTFNMDPKRLDEAIKSVLTNGKLKPKGVIPVDLFGLPANYDPIISLAEEHGMAVIEDAAQSLGGSYRERRAGSLGHVGATSFFPSKPLGCYGDGGAIFTDDEELAEKIISIRIHGKGSHKYQTLRLGINGRLDTLQAAVLLAKLEVFPQELRARQRIAMTYNKGLESIVEVPVIPDGFTSAWAQYSILTERRAVIQANLHERGIPTAIYYPTPLHLQPVFAYLGYKERDFPVAEATARRILSLPMHPYLTDAELGQIVEAIREYVRPFNREIPEQR